MDKTFTLPKFESEADEAKWWFDNQDLVFEEFERAGQEGRLGRGTAMQQAKVAAGEVIVLDAADAERARVQAERRGLEYKAYLKSIVQRALTFDEKSA